MYVCMIEVTFWTFIHHELFIIFHLYKFIKVINYHIHVDLISWAVGIMSLLRHSILRQSLLRHLLLRQSLLRLLILRQWPIVFAILALLAIQMQYGTAHLTWKGHVFLSRSRKFFSYAALLFLKLFSAAQQNIFYKRKYSFM